MTGRMTTAATLAALLIGALAGYWLHGTELPRPESTAPAAAVRQEDGSMIAERAPPAADKPLAPAPHTVPKGMTEERRIAVDVQSKQADCDPVRVDLSLVRDGEGRRVIASSPDGTVTQALDIPIGPALMPAPVRKWAAGGSWNPGDRTYGLWLERDMSRFRLGAEVAQDPRGGLQAAVRVGWTW